MTAGALYLDERRSNGLTQVALIIAVFGFVFGTDLIIKDYLPNSIGPLIETAFRWLPALALISLTLASGALFAIPTSPMLLLLLLMIFQSVLRSPDLARSAIEFLRELPVYLMALLIPFGSIGERRFWSTIFLATLALCILSLVATIPAPELAYTGYEWGPSVRRLEGVAPQAVSLGFISGLCVVLGTGLALNALKSGSIAFVAMFFGGAFIAALCLLETQSRGPLGGTLFAIGLLFLLYATAGPMRVIAFLSLGILVPLGIFGMYLMVLLTPLDQMLTLATSGSDRMMTLAERALIWDTARADIAQSPFWGHGYRLDFHVEHYLADEDGMYPSYHSAFIGVWRDAGVFAALSLIGIVTLTYFRSLGRAMADPKGNLAGLRVGVIGFVLLCGTIDSALSGGVMLMATFGAYGFSRGANH